MVRNSRNCGPRMFSVKALLTFAVLMQLSRVIWNISQEECGVSRHCSRWHYSSCYHLLLKVQNRYSLCSQHE